MALLAYSKACQWKKEKCQVEREGGVVSSLLIFSLKDDMQEDSGKEGKSEMFRPHEW